MKNAKEKEIKIMTYFTSELANIAIFISCGAILSIILFIAVYILSFTSKVEFEKSSAYECGFQPFEEAQYPFEISFSLIAIMFLLFDIEVLYLYPLFTSILDVGIVYEISRQIMSMGMGVSVKAPISESSCFVTLTRKCCISVVGYT